MLFLLASAGMACNGSIGTLEKERPSLGASGAGRNSGASGAGNDAASDEATSGAGGAGSDAGGAVSGGAAGGSASAGSAGNTAGAAGADQGTPPPVVSCDAITQVFQVSCGGGVCHTNPGAGIGDWGIGMAEALEYVDRASIRDPSCGKIIDSSDYSKSLILVKLEGPLPAVCGGPMPVGSFVEVTPQQVGCVASWLEQFQK